MFCVVSEDMPINGSSAKLDIVRNKKYSNPNNKKDIFQEKYRESACVRYLLRKIMVLINVGIGHLIRVYTVATCPALLDIASCRKMDLFKF